LSKLVTAKIFTETFHEKVFLLYNTKLTSGG